MTKTRKSTKTVGLKIILYTVLALIVFIVIGTASDRQMVSEASAITRGFKYFSIELINC